jgi:hypothetical protein
MGFHANTPLASIDPLPKGIPRGSDHRQAHNFAQEISAHRKQARDAMALAQAAQARAYNKGRRVEEFEKGDLVMVNPHSLELVESKRPGRKLVQRRIGPFPISEKINPLAYRLQLPPEYPMHPVVNIEHLQKYRPSNIANRAHLPHLRELLDIPETEVEHIIGHRFNHSIGRLEYLVKWKGFPAEEATFLPESALRNAFLRLRQYRAGQKNAADGT